MWAQYFKEREGFETIENDKGCLTYRISGDECYIKDIFVLKEHRRSNVATELADECSKIARDSNCKFLSGTIVPSTRGATDSMMGLVAYGFEIRSAQVDLIILVKEF